MCLSSQQALNYQGFFMKLTLPYCYLITNQPLNYSHRTHFIMHTLSIALCYNVILDVASSYSHLLSSVQAIQFLSIYEKPGIFSCTNMIATSVILSQLLHHYKNKQYHYHNKLNNCTCYMISTLIMLVCRLSTTTTNQSIKSTSKKINNLTWQASPLTHHQLITYLFL